MADLLSSLSREMPFALPKAEGYNARWNEKWMGYDIEVPNGRMFYAESFFNAKWSDRTVEYLQEADNVDWRKVDWRGISQEELSSINFKNVEWKQDHIKLYGKLIPLPRLTSWHGDPGAAYTYSGIKSEPNKWNEGLLYLKHRIEECTETEFNSVLLNWYRDGQDSLSWHSDDEKELGEAPLIASANFGASRDFLIRPKEDKSLTISIPLKHGTLLVMGGPMQHFWQHSIPKRSGVKQSRFNMTFRRITPTQ